MSSEPPPGPAAPAVATALDRLSALLTELGLAEPGPVELAELLWLAARGGEDGSGTEPGGGSPRGARRPGGGAAGGGARNGTARGRGPADGQSLRTALHLPSDDPADGVAAAAPVPTPSAPMLARPLALQRALRPLKRQVPDPQRSLLDEAATAHRLAEALRGPGPVRWLPVLRPSTERWLDLHLVLDCGPTMALWRPLALELRTLLLQTGAFRQVALSCLDASGELLGRRTADARTAVLVLSDCMGPQWRPGVPGARWHRTLHSLARRAPVAVVQPLPERLWPLAAVPAAAGVLSASEAGAPNSAYGFAPFTSGAPGWGEVAVPVMEPTAGWLANWARLVGSPTGGQVVGSALLVGTAPAEPAADTAAGPEPAELAAEELVLRFRAVASQEAFALAGLTALTTPALPVMRLLQRASFARPQPQHLAEVVVSGLLREREGRRDHFEFRSGVRELLLHTLPRSTTHRAVGLLARVGEQIAARAGRVPNEFAALAAVEAEESTATAERQAFALISPAALRMLDGPAAPTLQPVAEPGKGAVSAPASAPKLPDPQRSRAVLLLTTSRVFPGDPLGQDDLRAQNELTGLVAALSSSALVGLDPDHIWVGQDDPQGFLSALRTAVSEAEDTLVVYVGGETVTIPGEGWVLGSTAQGVNPSLSWSSLMALVGTEGRARKRLMLFDGWAGADSAATLPEAVPTMLTVDQLISVRPQGTRSLAGWLNQALRDGKPGGPPELAVQEIVLALCAIRVAERETVPGAFQFDLPDRPYEPPFLLSRNPAVTGLTSPEPQPTAQAQTVKRPAVPSHSRPRRLEPDAAVASAQPYFFLSHAPSEKEQTLVERLFNDLCEEVLQLTDLPAEVPPGHLDSAEQPDTAAELRSTEALAVCRVFVPLYSPRYFLSERCGREWSAFAQRPRGSGRLSGVVPALWTPVRGAELPTVAGRLRYVDSSLGPEYASEGLYGLATLRPLRAQYELAVHRLATRIVEVAHATRIPPGRPLNRAALGNAFAT